jgi:hypothetical protein
MLDYAEANAEDREGGGGAEAGEGGERAESEREAKMRRGIMKRYRMRVLYDGTLQHLRPLLCRNFLPIPKP